jgi:hypothetical protein
MTRWGIVRISRVIPAALAIAFARHMLQALPDYCQGETVVFLAPYGLEDGRRHCLITGKSLIEPPYALDSVILVLRVQHPALADDVVSDD